MRHEDRHALRRSLKESIHAEIERRHPNYRLVKSLTWGAALIAFGVAWLVSGDAPWNGMTTMWRWMAPAFIASTGLIRIILVHRAWAVVSGMQRFAIAAWLFVVLNGEGGWTFQNSWPLLVVIAGIGMVARGLMERDAMGTMMSTPTPAPATPASPPAAN